MKLDRLLAVSLALGLVSTSALAQDDPYDNRWYFGAAGGLVWPDGDRLTDDDVDLHYGVSIGRFFSPSMSVDLRFDRYQLDYDEATPGTSSRQQSIGLVGRYHFREGQDTRPYIMAGLGIQDHKSIYDKGRDVYGSVGLGVLHTYSDRVSMRLEGEYRHDNDRDTFNTGAGFDDFMLTLGFNFAIGERARAPQPEPMPEPAPQPVRRPTPEPIQARQAEPEPEPEVVFEFSAAVTFDLNSARLQPSAIAELNDAVEVLSMHTQLSHIEIAGHTCDLGAAGYNQTLSEQRAQAVRDYLVEHGIAADRLSVRGYGEDRPKVPNTSDSNRQQNRRVELVVMGKSEG
ncbi:OmpA family protein [Wenzhouxiangella marina]|uniref:Outer membrane protein/peptidoglycan-associated (Lipo)protein n=1 Tax=Wenzhouxiangella marina TaxID=1579979 RepID=A0A0K0XUY7_9GAMM|nr:OmpA family protein [Wenzhouxiangella marina]AKS41480.1 Outer membrane protein/peptidoglycan-associated (Lipo)protein [Wenzhouxiangella marina]MBB6086762.1 OOP family OmpA-OmpF porin [Wenzhouxiangella marina]